VEEIVETAVLPDSFERDARSDIHRHAERGVGSFENEREHGDVMWRFSARAASHARRFLFHPSHTVEEERDGSLLVRFKAQATSRCAGISRCGATPSRCSSRPGCATW
jgi:hypothetical protein